MEIPDITLPDINRHRETEVDFINDIVEVNNTAKFLLMTFVSLIPDKTIGMRKQGVLIGFMVRIYKLFDTFCYLSAGDRLESAWIFTRLLTEAGLELLYLIKCDDDAIYEKFIKSSLAYDKQLIKQIEDDESDKTKSVRDRMTNSIESRFKRNGYKTNDINFRHDKDWRPYNYYELAKQLDLLMVYEVMYRTATRSIHADWYEFESYNLVFEDGKYSPELQFHSTKPQILTATAISVLEIVRQYIDLIYNYDKDTILVLHSALDEIIRWYKTIDSLHEKFISE